MKYILERLKERSTWLGIAGMITLIVGSSNVELREAIVTVGLAVVSGISILLKDKETKQGG